MLISAFDTSNIERLIEEFETKYDFNFPKEYKAFLMKYNGGLTPKSSFRTKKVSSDITGFFGLGTANASFNYSFFEKIDIDILKDYIKAQMIPIAKNSCGDHILLGIDSENYSKVYFKYHDMPKKYIELAESFALFISKCKSEKLVKILSIEDRIELMKARGNKITDLHMKAWQAEIDRQSKYRQEELIL